MERIKAVQESLQRNIKDVKSVDSTTIYYTSRGHGCGIYKLLIFVDSKAMKQAHSKLVTVSTT